MCLGKKVIFIMACILSAAHVALLSQWALSSSLFARLPDLAGNEYQPLWRNPAGARGHRPGVVTSQSAGSGVVRCS